MHSFVKLTALAIALSGSAIQSYAAEDDVELYPYPDGRYTAYSELSTEVNNAATGLGYTQEEWDVPGSKVQVEYLSWFTLNNTITEFEMYATTIGFTTISWDCWVNHYIDYFWSEMVDEGVDQYWRALGYTELKWNGTDPSLPPSEEKKWAELTSEEQLAAEQICYMSQSWDTLTLPYVFEDVDDEGNVEDEVGGESSSASSIMVSVSGLVSAVIGSALM